MSKQRVQKDSILKIKKWTYGHLAECNVASYFTKWSSRNFGTAPIYNVLQDGCPNKEFVLGLTKDGNGVATEGSGCINWEAISDGEDFSMSLRPRQFHLLDKHGDDWEDCSIAAAKTNGHDGSMAVLGRIKTRLVDQARFDALAGVSEAPSFLHDLGTGTRNDFVALNLALKRRTFMLPTAGGYLPEVGKGVRTKLAVDLPLGKCSKEEPEAWTFHLDSYMLEQLALDPSMLKVSMSADVRGKENRAITLNFDGYKISNLVLVEAPSYIGSRRDINIDMMKDTVQKAGLRRYAVIDNKMIWEGCKEFEDAETQWLSDPASVKIYSRGFIVGNGALVEAYDTSRLKYTFQSGDHDECSSSKLKYVYNVKKTRLTAENSVCADGISDVDYAVITVDMLHKPLTVCDEACENSRVIHPTPMVDAQPAEDCEAQEACEYQADPVVIPEA